MLYIYIPKQTTKIKKPEPPRNSTHNRGFKKTDVQATLPKVSLFWCSGGTWVVEWSPELRRR